MLEFEPLSLGGAYLIRLPRSSDSRGDFCKFYHGPSFDKAGIDFVNRESYFSISHKDVIRGMHFQLPPQDHAKIVSCPQGSILDVILDLRKESPTYGEHISLVLSDRDHQAVYLPKGLAHGFKSLEDGTMTLYLVSSAYAPLQDAGIHYASFGMDWDCPSPMLSERDRGFPEWNDFQSPF